MKRKITSIFSYAALVGMAWVLWNAGVGIYADKILDTELLRLSAGNIVAGAIILLGFGSIVAFRTRNSF